MPTLAPERTAEEIIAGWRRGADDGGGNPAGPLFPGGDFAEFEITMTGSGGGTNTTTIEIISCAIPERYDGECCW